jgi:hypothetical protein
MFLYVIVFDLGALGDGETDGFDKLFIPQRHHITVQSISKETLLFNPNAE